MFRFTLLSFVLKYLLYLTCRFFRYKENNQMFRALEGRNHVDDITEINTNVTFVWLLLRITPACISVFYSDSFGFA